MRIGLLSYEYPPETGFGGIGSYTWHHARALAKLGHEVHVLAGARRPTPLRTRDDDGVHVHRFWAGGGAMRAFHSLGRFGLRWSQRRLETAWSMYRGIAALHDDVEFDVLEMPECGAEGALATARLDVPTVVRLHSPAQLIMPFYDVSRVDTALCSAIERRALRRATMLTACSQFVSDEARRVLRLERGIEVIPNGLDVRWFDTAETAPETKLRPDAPQHWPTIVFAGRMERRKGIHLCTEIAISLLERREVSLVLVGDDLFGHVSGTLLPALAARRLKGVVHWWGRQSLAGVRRILRTADVFLLPSLWENCPYSCLEAMAAGRAVVATDQGGVRELIQDGVNGLLGAPGDAASFVRQIERLVDDVGLRRRLGAAARATVVAEHSHTHVATRTLGVYRDAISRWRRRGVETPEAHGS